MSSLPSTFQNTFSWMFQANTAECAAPPGMTPMGMTPMAETPVPEPSAAPAPVEAPVAEPTGSSIKNPGLVNSLGLSALMLNNIEMINGFSFELQKNLNREVQATHQVSMGVDSPQGLGNLYNFQLLVVPDPKFLVLGTMGTNGLTHAMYKYTGPKVHCGVTVGAAQFPAAFELTYLGNSNTTEFSIREGAREHNMPNLYTASFTQAVHPNVVLSARTEAQLGTAPGVLSTVAKIFNDEHEVVLRGGLNAPMSASYHRQINKEFSIATTYTQAGVSIGYQAAYRANKLNASINQNFEIKARMEPLLSPNMKLLLTADLNHKTNQHKFGVGVFYAI